MPSVFVRTTVPLIVTVYHARNAFASDAPRCSRPSASLPERVCRSNLQTLQAG